MTRKSQSSPITPLRLVAFALLLAIIGMTAQSAAASSAHRAVHHKVRHKAKPRHRATMSYGAASSAPAPSGAQESAPAPPAPVSCGDGDLIPSPANIDRVRAATICLINQQRAANGLRTLRENGGLDAAAQRHTDDMIAQNYFGHFTPSGLSPLDRVVAAGYAAVGSITGLAENIAAGGGSLGTPSATVANWMTSPEHRTNILAASYTDTGVGVSAAVPSSLGIGQSGGTYTQTFGRVG